jgi:hypothetical protein
MEGRLYSILKCAMLQGRLSNIWHITVYYVSEGGMEGRLYSILKCAMLQGHLSNTWHIILFECGWNGRPSV